MYLSSNPPRFLRRCSPLNRYRRYLRFLRRKKVAWFGLFLVSCIAVLQVQPILRNTTDKSFLVPYLLINESPKDSDYPDYENLPIGLMRPTNQFTFGNTFCRNGAELSDPVLTVLTVTRDTRLIMKETAEFIRSQSLCAIRWVIVNDHTTDRQSFRLLEQLAARDRRIKLINSTYEEGFSNGRNFALKELKSSPSPYFAFLDDDDFLELTGYEKLVWLLESNRGLDLAGSYIVGFGEKNYTWNRGFHDGSSVYLDMNPLSGSEVMRTSVLHETPCQFDRKLTSGMEDWDFYLCLASHGKWGGTVPDFLFWYRQNPASLRKQRWNSLFEEKEKTTEYIRSQYSKLSTRFPEPSVETADLSQISTSVVFRNLLRGEKGVMIILSQEDVIECNGEAMSLIRRLGRSGQRVTAVNTLINVEHTPGFLHRCCLGYTHDIFELPSMLKISDVPRFLSYLIASRNIDRVFVSSAGYGMGVVPWLAYHYPGVQFYPIPGSKLTLRDSQSFPLFIRRFPRCMPVRTAASRQIAIEDNSPITYFAETVLARLPKFRNSAICGTESLSLMHQVLKDFADVRNDGVQSQYKHVYEFLLHSIWPKVE